MSPIRRVFPHMPPRDPQQEHRAATPLELFFDLAFVVAVAQAAAELHHAVAADHALEGLLSYVMVFFAIWWAWMNFSWFASSYDTDDVPYRVVVFVQITGALMLAAGVGDAFGGNWRTVTIGFVVMRFAMVFQWLRAATHHPEGRQAALRNAIGIAFMQALWVSMLWFPEHLSPTVFFLFVGGELLVPYWGARVMPDRLWHDDHIAERYGLFTIIVLGESILAASLAINQADDTAASFAQLWPTIAGGLLTVFSLWWLYFARSAAFRLASMKSAFLWGYGHYLIFGAGAAVGAGIAVLVDYETGKASIDLVAAAYALAIPVAIFAMTLWVLHWQRGNSLVAHVTLPLTALVVLAMPFTAQPALGIGLTVAVSLAFKLYRYRGTAR